MAIRIAEETAPSTPPSGKASLYVDSSDSIPKIINDAGTVYSMAGATITGTPSNNQIMTATSATAIQGESNLTFDGTTLAVTGNITVSGTVDGVDVSGLPRNPLVSDLDTAGFKIKNTGAAGSVILSAGSAGSRGEIKIQDSQGVGTDLTIAYSGTRWRFDNQSSYEFFNNAADNCDLYVGNTARSWANRVNSSGNYRIVDGTTGSSILQIAAGAPTASMDIAATTGAITFDGGTGDKTVTLVGDDGSLDITAGTENDFVFTRSNAGTSTMDFRALTSNGTSDAQFRFGISNGTTGAQKVIIYDRNSTNIQHQLSDSTSTGTSATRFCVQGGRLSYFGATAVVQQTGVAVTAAGIHAALVAYGLITA